MNKVYGLLILVVCWCGALAAQDGGVDFSFDPGEGADGWVQGLAIQPDGKILIGGNFNNVHTHVCSRIARLHPNGSVDTGFVANVGENGTVSVITLQEDGRILIGGSFVQVNGSPRTRIARLLPSGELDPEFNPNAGAPSDQVSTIAVQSDGKILVGGTFTTMNGQTRNRIARLNSDGALDEDFDPNAGGSISTIVLQPNGQILLGGNFQTLAGVERNRIARLNSDGALDEGFNPNAAGPGGVGSIVVQPDGKILIGGFFTTLGGVTHNRIARLNANGTVDDDFNVGIGASHPVRDLKLQPDGKIVVGGQFTKMNNVDVDHVTRLLPTGALDPNFHTGPGQGPNNHVFTLALQADGKAVIVGQFQTPYKRVARLEFNGAVIAGDPPLTAMVGQLYTYVINAIGQPVPTVTVEGLPDWLDFDDINTISGTPGEADIGTTTGPITITAINDLNEASQTFQIQVVGVPPEITSAPLTQAFVGQAYAYAVKVEGIPTPDLSVGPLPAWLALDAATGELSGVPPGTAAGSTVDVLVEASNGWGEPATQAFTVTVQSTLSSVGVGAGGGCASGSGGVPTTWLLALVGLAGVLGRRRLQRFTRM